MVVSLGIASNKRSDPLGRPAAPIRASFLELVRVPKVRAGVDIAADAVMVDVVGGVGRAIIACVPSPISIRVRLVGIRGQDTVVVIVADSISVTVRAAAESDRGIGRQGDQDEDRQ
jgi:hypothetical protein|tara:strand:- start:61 stop:408 length:348 start_codon:yes stop_codon:yes gene_type:complete